MTNQQADYLLSCLFDYDYLLNEWEDKFVRNLIEKVDRQETLTEKQTTKLQQIFDKIVKKSDE